MKVLKNKYFWIVLVALFIIGSIVGNDEEQVQEASNTVKEVPKKEPVETEVKSEKKTETKEPEKKPEQTKPEEKDAEELKTEITLEEFNQKFKQDPEETQYPNGKFELKDGSIINADYLMYGENDLFYFAIAIFHEGKLVAIQMETDKSLEEIEKGMGIKFPNGTAAPYAHGYEVNFNIKFYEDNIVRYPNEWE